MNNKFQSDMAVSPPVERLLDILEAKLEKTRAIVGDVAMKVGHLEARLFDSPLRVDEPNKQQKPHLCFREELLSGMEEIQEMAVAIGEIVERI